eukprot:TRINITY_DN16463_c0_g1_i1.p1 TRINITY_DN16463_c0_g1~~TRINITY_DN16463_c0_g1_i1.p1  ORF type:complete len:167 (+),score=39.27 TRINITY_DN16463_c0_g1_i1:65-565(+)
MLHSNNGNCTWSQTDDEVEFKVPVPTSAKSRDVHYELKSKHVTVGLSEQEHIKNMELCHAVITADSHWQLEDSRNGREVVVTLRKARAGVSWRALMLADCPKPPMSSHDTSFKGWETEGKKEDTAPPLADYLPAALASIEPGTLAACLFLLLSLCVGLFKTYLSSK